MPINTYTLFLSELLTGHNQASNEQRLYVSLEQQPKYNPARNDNANALCSTASY